MCHGIGPAGITNHTITPYPHNRNPESKIHPMQDDGASLRIRDLMAQARMLTLQNAQLQADARAARECAAQIAELTAHNAMLVAQCGLVRSSAASDERAASAGDRLHPQSSLAAGSCRPQRPGSC